MTNSELQIDSEIVKKPWAIKHKMLFVLGIKKTDIKNCLPFAVMKYRRGLLRAGFTDSKILQLPVAKAVD